MIRRGGKILIVGDDPHLRASVSRLVRDLGEVLESEATGVDLADLRYSGLDVAVVDLGPVGRPGDCPGDMPILQKIREAIHDVLVLALCAGGDSEVSAGAVEAGAYGLLTKPLDPAEVHLLVQRGLERRQIDRQAARLQDEVERRHDLSAIVGVSPPIEALRTAIRKIAESDTEVLIRGESGSGRELAARAIHFSSPRRRGPFVTFRTSLLAVHQIESSLFGGRDGPSGSDRAREGRASLADQGTLFIDEVAALPPTAQSRLFRLIESGEIERPSDLHPVAADLRLISATARDLESEVAARRFRKDLHDRLAIVRLDVPSLRERVGDIPLLAATFLSRACAARGIPERRLSPAALACLGSYRWPGNVSELQDLMENISLATEQPVIQPEDLPAHLRGPSRAAWPPPSIPEEGILWERQVEGFERSLLEQALKLSKGKKSAAAQRLGLKKDQMKYLCRKYSL